MEKMSTEDLHGFQRICGSQNFCQVFVFMLILYIVSDFQKRYVSQKKGEEPFLCHKFSRRERKRKSVRKRWNSVYEGEERTVQRLSESRKAHMILFLLLCYLLLLLGWPWPTPLAAVQEGPTLRCSPCAGAARRTFK